MLIKLAWLCPETVRSAPLRLCFYFLIYAVLFNFLTQTLSLKLAYDRCTLLHIGKLVTNGGYDPLNGDQGWPKSKGGGVCFNLTILCCPFHLRSEFTSIIVTAVYIPPQADTDTALSDLRDVLCQLQTKHPNAALIVAGDFNKAKLKKVLLNFYQHVPCSTRGNNTLDHCYTPFKEGYKAMSLPPLGKSDHATIFLVPKYKQRIAQEKVVTRQVRCWNVQSEATLQDALSDVDCEYVPIQLERHERVYGSGDRFHSNACG